MAKRYKVRDKESGKVITFNWRGEKPPTEKDLEEVFAEARTTDPSRPLSEFQAALPATTAQQQVDRPGIKPQLRKTLEMLKPSAEVVGLIKGGQFGARVGGLPGLAVGAGLGFGVASELTGLAEKGLDIEGTGETPLTKFFIPKSEKLPQSVRNVLEGSLIELTGGLGTRLISTVGRGVGKVAREVLGRTTGAGEGAITEAFRGGKSFREALRGRVSQEEILEKAIGALETVRADRSTNYISRLEELGKIKKSINIQPVHDKLRQLLRSFNIKETKEGLEFSRSTLNKTAQKDVSEILEIVKSWGKKAGDRTPAGLDILKRRLDDFYSESKNSRAIVTALRNEVKNQLVKEVPEYAVMTGEYSKATALIKEIERALSLGKKSAADTAVRKLNSAMRENFGFRRTLLEQLSAQGEVSNLPEEIAGEALKNIMPRGLSGLGSIGVAGVGLYSDPRLLPLLTLASPRLVGEFVNLLGSTSRKMALTNLTLMSIRGGLVARGQTTQSIDKNISGTHNEIENLAKKSLKVYEGSEQYQTHSEEERQRNIQKIYEESQKEILRGKSPLRGIEDFREVITP